MQVALPDKIAKRTSSAILRSLSAGVVPRVGVELIAVGREQEMRALDQDLADIREGDASFRLIVGRYGAGKSFLMQMLRNRAIQQKFVVADADLSPQRRLAGSKGEGLALYRELLAKMAFKGRARNAYPALIEKWINGIQREVAKDIDPEDREFDRTVAGKVREVVGRMEDMVHGFEFAEIINAYWHGHRDGDDERKGAAMRWLRGEFDSKREAQRALRGHVRAVNSIIDDSSWYDFLKLLAYFVRQLGYQGLVVFIDEAENLYKLPNAISRESNYRRLLDMLNDTVGGTAEHLGLYFGATPVTVEDTRRGFFSNGALRGRLEERSFARSGLRDMTSPQIKLDTLNQAEIRQLLSRVEAIHRRHFQYESRLSDEQIKDFMARMMNRIGADSLLTPRDVLRDFVAVLNLLQQNPDATLASIMGEFDFASGDASQPHGDAESQYSSFTI